MWTVLTAISRQQDTKTGVTVLMGTKFHRERDLLTLITMLKVIPVAPRMEGAKEILFADDSLTLAERRSWNIGG